MSVSASINIKIWHYFFNKYLPSWELRLKFANQILIEDPDHILFPGGKASLFSDRLGEKNINEIVKWVEKGGSYIGVCAGAYLASNSSKKNIKGIGITPLVRPTCSWKRGSGLVYIEINEDLFKFESKLKIERKKLEVKYVNGPIFMPNSDIEVWATYKSNLIVNSEDYPMLNSPAITYNKFREGQVTLFSPHLESSEDYIKVELAKLFEKIINLVSKK